MKHVILSAFFKAACSILILILLAIGFVYGTRSLSRENLLIKYIDCPRITAGYQAIIENLGVHRPWFRDVWPFDRPMNSGW